MGATSVTGVGPGSADGANKGSEHMTLSVSKLIGPRVVVAGSVTLASNVASIQFPLPTGSASDYIVLATAVNASTANAVVVTAFTVASATTSQSSSNLYSPAGSVSYTSYDATLSLKGAGASDVVNYAVIKVGNGSL